MAANDTAGSEYVIEVRDLWWRYRGSPDWALKGVSLKVRAGEFLGITGHSGAGKTTLCMALNGLIPQRSQGEMRGRVVVAGLDTARAPLKELTRRVGMVFQDPETQFVTMSVEDEVAFPLENFAFPREEMVRRVEEALQTVGIRGLRHRYPYELSGGQKQRVAIAAGLALRPPILVLDEPTSDLDPVGKQEVFEVIADLKRRFDTTLVVVEHNTEELARYADRIILLHEGEVVREGPPKEFFSDVALVKARGVYPPQTVELFHTLGWGWDGGGPPLTVEEAVRLIRRRLKRVEAVSSMPVPKSYPTPLGEPVIQAEGLHYTYPDGTEALRGVELEVRRGEYLAIIGQNGSGKTTLVKHFVGILKPTRGRVVVLGSDTRDLSVADLATRVGYTYQNPDHQLVAETVYDECAYGPRNLGLPEEEVKQRVEEALAAVGLRGLEDRPPFFLSKGQRQRLAVASVLTLKPQVIIVDEPTTGQDMVQSEGMMGLLDRLNREGRTLIVITHNMEIVARHIPRTVVLQGGRVILDGPTPRVLAEVEALAKASITPPQVIRLAHALKDLVVAKEVATVEALAALLHPAR